MSTKFTLWIIDDKWMIVWYYDAYQDKNTCRLKLGTQKKNKVGNSEILFLSTYQGETKSCVHKNTSTRMFIASVFTIAPNQKQPKC